MAKIGLFFGSTTGNTANVAKMIKEKLGSETVDIFNVQASKAEDMQKYEVLIFGTSTWGYGEPQDDWATFESSLDNINFEGKAAAFFGLGDQYSYGETFVDAMGLLYETIKAKGAKIAGMWPTEGYEYDSSKSVVDGKFVGLALDEDNQADMTEKRIKTWIEQLKSELEL
jgi:flavodoxin I